MPCSHYSCIRCKDELQKAIDEITKQTKSKLLPNNPEQWLLLSQKSRSMLIFNHQLIITLDGSGKVFCMGDITEKYTIIKDSVSTITEYLGYETSHFLKLGHNLFACGEWRNGGFWNKQLEEQQKKKINYYDIEQNQWSLCNGLYDKIKDIKKDSRGNILDLNNPSHWFQLDGLKIVIDVVITADEINKVVPMSVVKRLYPVLAIAGNMKIVSGTMRPKDKSEFYRITDHIYMNGEWKDDQFYNEAFEELQELESYANFNAGTNANTNTKK